MSKEVEFLKESWPGEYLREPDGKGNTDIECCFDSVEEYMSLILLFSKKWNLLKATLNHSRPDKFDVVYNFRPFAKALQIKVYHHLNFGTFNYGKDGNPCSLSLESLRPPEFRYQEEAVTPEDQSAVDKETRIVSRYFGDIIRFKGHRNLSKEEKRRLQKLLPATLAQDLKRKEWIAQMGLGTRKIEFREGLLYIPPASNEDKGSTTALGQPFFLDSEIKCVELSEDKLTTLQVVSGQNRRATVPGHFTYSLMKSIILSKEKWSDIFSLYPVSLDNGLVSLSGNAG